MKKGYILGSSVAASSAAKGFQIGALLNLDSDVQTFLSGLTTPLSTTDKTRINTLVKSIKSGLGISSLSEAFDKFRIPCATAEASLRNLAKDAHHATAVNSPVFTAYEGFAGDGVSAYIDENYNPSSDGVNYTLNNSLLGIYSRTENTTLGADIGAREGEIFTRIWSYITGAGSSMRMHQGGSSSDQINIPGLGTRGMFILQRISNTTIELFKNKNNYQNTTSASVVIPNLNFYSSARNSDGVAEYFSDRQYSTVFIGCSLSQSEVDVITDAFESYMDSYGKGVIS